MNRTYLQYLSLFHYMSFIHFIWKRYPIRFSQPASDFVSSDQRNWGKNLQCCNRFELMCVGQQDPYCCALRTCTIQYFFSDKPYAMLCAPSLRLRCHQYSHSLIQQGLCQVFHSLTCTVLEGQSIIANFNSHGPAWDIPACRHLLLSGRSKSKFIPITTFWHITSLWWSVIFLQWLGFAWWSWHRISLSRFDSQALGFPRQCCERIYWPYSHCLQCCH